MSSTQNNVTNVRSLLNNFIEKEAPFGPHSIIRGDIDCVGGRIVSDGETEIGDATSAVPFH